MCVCVCMTMYIQMWTSPTYTNKLPAFSHTGVSHTVTPVLKCVSVLTSLSWCCLFPQSSDCECVVGACGSNHFPPDPPVLQVPPGLPLISAKSGWENTVAHIDTVTHTHYIYTTWDVAYLFPAAREAVYNCKSVETSIIEADTPDLKKRKVLNDFSGAWFVLPDCSNNIKHNISIRAQSKLPAPY